MAVIYSIDRLFLVIMGPLLYSAIQQPCASCFGPYDEDINSENGNVTCLCTNEDSCVWMHKECLDKCDGDLCIAVFD